MVTGPLDKSYLRRLRGLMKKEQARSGKSISKRMMRFFRSLRNIDERIYAELTPEEVKESSKTNHHVGYSVRGLRTKGGWIALKLPTTTVTHYKISAKEEIRFVRRLVDAVNSSITRKDFVLNKPVGHVVGPFFAMKFARYPNINELKRGDLSPRAKRMVEEISKSLKISENEVISKLYNISSEIDFKTLEILTSGKIPFSKNYPAGDELKNRQGRNDLEPLDARHLLITGVKEGVIQIVPLIDAI